jgi:hypothetical protein
MNHYIIFALSRFRLEYRPPKLSFCEAEISFILNHIVKHKYI